MIMAGKILFPDKGLLSERSGKMNRNPIKILYAVSPETVDILSARLRPVAAAMKLRMAGSRMYLEVTVDDRIFDSGILRDDRRKQADAESASRFPTSKKQNRVYNLLQIVKSLTALRK